MSVWAAEKLNAPRAERVGRRKEKTPRASSVFRMPRERRKTNKRKAPVSFASLPVQVVAAVDSGAADNKFNNLRNAVVDVPEKNVRPFFIGENDRSYQSNDYQHRIAKAVVSKLLDRSAPNIATVAADGGWGKTVTAGLINAYFAGRAQIQKHTKGNTLFLYTNASTTETSQGRMLGAFKTAMFTASNKDLVGEVASEIGLRGAVCVMARYDGFYKFLSGSSKAGAPKFVDFEEADFERRDAEEFVKSSFTNEKLPAICTLVEEWNITNVVVTVDEFHLRMSQETQNFVCLLANAQKLSQVSWIPKKFNFFVVGLSATPDATWRISKESHTLNKVIFYSGKLAKTTPDTNELCNQLTTNGIVKASAQENTTSLTRFNWCRGVNENNFENTTRWPRLSHISDPIDNSVLRTVAMCVLACPLICQESDQHKDSVYAQWTLDTTKEIVAFSPRRSGVTAEFTIVSPPFCQQVYKDFLNDVDCATFLNGGYSTDSGPNVSALNVADAKKITMRKVVKVAESQDDDCEFQPAKSFHCVLVGIEASAEQNLVNTKTAVHNINSNPNSTSIVFDLTQCDAHQREVIVNSKVKEAVEKNKKQVVIVVLAKQTQGVCYFSPFASAAVYIGDDKASRLQFFNRLGRTPNTEAFVGMLVPCIPTVGYLRLSLVSNFTLFAEYDGGHYAASRCDELTGTHLAAWQKVVHDKYLKVRFAKSLFRLSNPPIPLDVKYPTVRLEGDNPNLVAVFDRLLQERNSEVGGSDTWKNFFLRYLETVTALRPKKVVQTEIDGDE
jgi:hypothetical protein